MKGSVPLTASGTGRALTVFITTYQVYWLQLVRVFRALGAPKRVIASMSEV